MKDSIELRDRGCRFCNERSIKPSYDDEDGMIACVHDTPPICGRRLKPYDEEEYLDACNG